MFNKREEEFEIKEQQKEKDLKRIIYFRNYAAIEIIGSGGFGEVYKCQKEDEINSENFYAIKKVKYQGKKGGERSIETEIKTLKCLKHENIVKFIDFFYIGNSPFMVMEYCKEGSLYNYLNSQPSRTLSEQNAVQIFFQICKGVKAIHEKNFIHRDLKCQNILMDKGVPKICDFGLSKILAKNQLTNSYCGTKSYFSPEILSKSKYNYKVDIWALGVILFRMLFKSYPFGSNSSADSLEKIKKRIEPFYILSENKSKQVSKEMCDFFKRVFVYDQENRISFEEMISHSVFDQLIDQSAIFKQQMQEIKQRLEKQQSEIEKLKDFDFEGEEEDLEQKFKGEEKKIFDQEEDEDELLLYQMESSINFFRLQKTKTKIYKNQVKPYNQSLLIYVFLINCQQEIESSCFLEDLNEKIKILVQFSILKIGIFHLENLIHCVFERINIFEIEDDWNQFANSSTYAQLYKNLNSMKKFMNDQIQEIQIQEVEIQKNQIIKNFVEQPIFINHEDYFLKIPEEIFLPFRAVLLQTVKEIKNSKIDKITTTTISNNQTNLSKTLSQNQIKNQTNSNKNKNINLNNRLIQRSRIQLKLVICALFNRIIKLKPHSIKLPITNKNKQNIKIILDWINSFQNENDIQQEIDKRMKHYFPNLSDFQYNYEII